MSGNPVKHSVSQSEEFQSVKQAWNACDILAGWVFCPPASHTAGEAVPLLCERTPIYCRARLEIARRRAAELLAVQPISTRLQCH